MEIKKIALVVLVLCSCISHASALQYRLIHNDSELDQPVTDTLQIKSIHLAFMSGLLVVKLKNKTRLIFSPGEVWGYEDEDGIYRYSGKQLYKVEQKQQLMIYSQRTGYKLLDKDYYFSKTRNSAILDMSKKNLRTEFSKNRCFQEKLDLFFDKKCIYFSIDDSESCAIITELYRQCKTG